MTISKNVRRARRQPMGCRVTQDKARRIRGATIALEAEKKAHKIEFCKGTITAKDKQQFDRESDTRYRKKLTAIGSHGEVRAGRKT